MSVHPKRTHHRSHSGQFEDARKSINFQEPINKAFEFPKKRPDDIDIMKSENKGIKGASAALFSGIMTSYQPTSSTSKSAQKNMKSSGAGRDSVVQRSTSTTDQTQPISKAQMRSFLGEMNLFSSKLPPEKNLVKAPQKPRSGRSVGEEFRDLLSMSSRLPEGSRMETTHAHVGVDVETDVQPLELLENERINTVRRYEGHIRRGSAGASSITTIRGSVPANNRFSSSPRHQEANQLSLLLEKIDEDFQGLKSAIDGKGVGVVSPNAEAVKRLDLPIRIIPKPEFISFLIKKDEEPAFPSNREDPPKKLPDSTEVIQEVDEEQDDQIQKSKRLLQEIKDEEADAMKSHRKESETQGQTDPLDNFEKKVYSYYSSQKYTPKADYQYSYQSREEGTASTNPKTYVSAYTTPQRSMVQSLSVGKEVNEPANGSELSLNSAISGKFTGARHVRSNSAYQVSSGKPYEQSQLKNWDHTQNTSQFEISTNVASLSDVSKIESTANTSQLENKKPAVEHKRAYSAYLQSKVDNKQNYVNNAALTAEIKAEDPPQRTEEKKPQQGYVPRQYEYKPKYEYKKPEALKTTESADENQKKLNESTIELNKLAGSHEQETMTEKEVKISEPNTQSSQHTSISTNQTYLSYKPSYEYKPTSTYLQSYYANKNVTK